MKFYVTARSSKYDVVKATFAEIKNRGGEVTFEWTEHKMIKPYNEHEVEAADFATQGICGVTEADVYIIYPHADGNGVYTEFGEPLAFFRPQPKAMGFDNPEQEFKEFMASVKAIA